MPVLFDMWDLGLCGLISISWLALSVKHPHSCWWLTRPQSKLKKGDNWKQRAILRRFKETEVKIINVFFDRYLSISGNEIVKQWFLAKMLAGFYLIDDHLTTDGAPDHTKGAHVLLSTAPCLLDLLLLWIVILKDDCIGGYHSIRSIQQHMLL